MTNRFLPWIGGFVLAVGALVAMLEPWEMNESVAFENQKTKIAPIQQTSNNSDQESLFNNPVDASVEQDNKPRKSGRAVTEFERRLGDTASRHPTAVEIEDVEEEQGHDQPAPPLPPASLEAVVNLVQCGTCWQEWLTTWRHTPEPNDADVALAQGVIKAGGAGKDALATLMSEPEIPVRAGYRLALLFVADDTQESFDQIKHAIFAAQAQKRFSYRDELLFTLRDINTPAGMERVLLFYGEAGAQGEEAITKSLEQTTQGLISLNTPPEAKATGH